MFCIVNSIDPLDLKEDDNVSNCSADSWELLDYEEKEIDNNNKNDTETTNKPEKKTSHVDDKDAAGPKRASKSGKNRKQKVSFKIPDLVNEKQTIELVTKPKEAANEQSKGSTKTGRKNKQDTLNKLSDLTSQTKSSNGKIGASSSSSSSSAKKDGVAGTIVKSTEPIEKAQAQPCARAPILNYAAALTAKLDNNNSKKYEPKILQKSTTDTTTTASSQVAGAAISQSKGVVKRNRPVSSSSWSSCDDEIINNNGQVWEDSEVNIEIGKSQNTNIKLDSLELPTNNNDDANSLASSGFSDCDYGFSGLNDYVMRPKKAQAKRRRNTSSTSSSLLTSMAKRGNAELPNKKNERTSVDVKDSKSKDLVSRQSTSSRSIKPKKKKLILSNQAATQSDFLKNPSENVSKGEETPQSDLAIRSQKSEISKVNHERQLMPPPTSVPASSTSGNDSSDILDMDESWYLTPPPCFTGAAANKLCIIPKPKAKEDARENLLIEHPSIYIASTSKQVTPPSKKSTNDILIKQKAIVLKKVSSKQSPSSSGSSSADEKKLTSSRTIKTNDKKNVKGWGNKFVIANWADDDQDDVNDDFDNLFPIMEKHSVIPKTKKSVANEKSKKDRAKKSEKRANNKSGAVTNSSDGYESDFSIPSPSLEEAVSDEPAPRPAGETFVNNFTVQGKNSGSKRRHRNKSNCSESKAPVKVDPIEPERQPGWQLKKKRSKRRPLVNQTVGPSVVSAKQPVSSIANSRQQAPLTFGPYGEMCYLSSAECSARSSPTLIDRIGSSIVANLSNLTSGFASSTGMNSQARAPLGEATSKMNQLGLITKSESGLNLDARKQMSKAFLNRQNSCSKVGSNRRADRRMKMHTTPNGVSVNRKVHTNFH